MDRHNAKGGAQARLRRSGRNLIFVAALAAIGLKVALHYTGTDESSARQFSCAVRSQEPGAACSADRDGSPLDTAVTGTDGGSSIEQSLAGLVRSAGNSRAAAATDQAVFSDLASATFRPRMVTRERYLTVAERCQLGMADASLRCDNAARPLSTTSGTRGGDQPDGHRIAGRVITAEGYGIPGVTLIASRIGASGDLGESDSTEVRSSTYQRYRAVSGVDGSYAFEDIPAGDYTIRSNKHDSYASLRVTVRTGVDYADLVLEEEREVMLEGTVTDEYGIPLSHVSVLPIVAGAANVRTDRSGSYRLPLALSPGISRVTLEFEAPGFHVASLSAPVPAAGGDFAAVARLDLDVALKAIELTTNVRGSVTTTDGKPLAGRRVELVALGTPERFQTVTQRDGSYQFPKVNAPMAYQMRVIGAPDHADYQARIQVSRYDYEFDAVLAPYQYGTIRGRIVDVEGAPIAGLELGYRNSASADANATLRSDSSGNFLLRRAPAGEAILTSQSMPNFIVRGLRVEPGGESTYEVVLDAGRHQITGRVVDRNGRPIPASRVVLNWAHESDGVSSGATRRTATDSLGSFSFDQLGPGPHSLVVDAPGFATATFDHDISRDGYSVTVRLN